MPDTRCNIFGYPLFSTDFIFKFHSVRRSRVVRKKQIIVELLKKSPSFMDPEVGGSIFLRNTGRIELHVKHYK